MAKTGNRVIAQDVADEAGVSLSAVSRAFTKGASVSKKTHEKVLAAADKLGYRPNALARSLMTRKTNLVGLLVSDFKNPVYLKIIDAMTNAIQKRGLYALLFNVSKSEGIHESVQMIMQYQVDGLIETSGGALDAKLISECSAKRTPLIQFGFHSKGRKVSSVCCNNFEGGRLAGKLLIDNGYKFPAYIGGDVGGAVSKERRKGFISALQIEGVQEWLTEDAGEWSYEAGYKVATQLLSLPKRPDALFCGDDILAIGVVDAARKLGLRVPEDVGIIGFDDIILADSDSYSLTTLQQPYEQMISEALDMLCARIENPSLKNKMKVLPCALVKRGTHGKAS